MNNDAKEKQQLEQLLGIEKELRDKRRRGDIDNLDYLVKTQHIRKTFGEQSPRSAHALALAEELLHWALTSEQQAAREKLLNTSVHEYGLWLTAYKEKCSGPLAMKILEGIQGIEAPPVPEPSQEATERAERAYNHRLGRDSAKIPTFAGREPTKSVFKRYDLETSRNAADSSGRADELVFHPDPTGETAGVMAPQRDVHATEVDPFDPRIHHEPQRPAVLAAARGRDKSRFVKVP